MNKLNEFELYIELGRACNLSCGHCLNKSGPNIELVEFSEDEVTYLSNLIENNLNIKSVHFSGGEPTLYRNTIMAIQKSIKRNIKFSLTTNGALGGKIVEWLQEIKLDSVNLSVDFWHDKYVDKKILTNFITQVKSQDIQLQIQVVIEKLEELINYEWLSDLGLNIQHYYKEKSGRSIIGSRECRYGLKDSCPSLQRPQLKLNWYRGSGFSICCGPLLFDSLADKQFLFFQDFRLLSDSQLYKLHSQDSLDEKMKKIGLSSKKFMSPCEACIFLYKKRKSLGDQSFHQMLSSNSKYFSIQREVDNEDWRDLNPEYSIKYIIINNNPQSLTTNAFIETPLNFTTITKKSFQRSDIHGLLDFVKSNFFERWSEFRTEKDFLKLAAITPEYLKREIQGFWYIKDNSYVGLLIYSLDKNHPILQTPVIHIGHWGYQKHLLSREEARQIKNDWINELARFAKNNGFPPLTGAISDFNISSLNMAKKLGFKITHFRLDKRGS